MGINTTAHRGRRFHYEVREFVVGMNKAGEWFPWLPL